MRKYIPISIAFFIICIFLLHYLIFKNKNADQQSAINELIIADFNDHPNKIGDPAYTNLGGQYGVWNRFEDDPTQSCTLSFSHLDAFKNGSSVQLTYDVDSPNPAYNGFWMKLNDLDATHYNTLNIYIRGEGKRFTKRLKVELKDNYTTASYVVHQITNNWKKFSISFEKYNAIQDWASLYEFVIVFDDIISNPKSGVILIDHVSLSLEHN